MKIKTGDVPFPKSQTIGEPKIGGGEQRAAAVGQILARRGSGATP